MTTFETLTLILLALIAANATAGVLLLRHYGRESDRREDLRARCNDVVPPAPGHEVRR